MRRAEKSGEKKEKTRKSFLEKCSQEEERFEKFKKEKDDMPKKRMVLLYNITTTGYNNDGVVEYNAQSKKK